MELVRVNPILPDGIPSYLTILFFWFSYFGNDIAMVCCQYNTALSYRPDIGAETVFQLSYSHRLHIFHRQIVATCSHNIEPSSDSQAGSILPGQHEGQQGVKLSGLEQVLKHDLLQLGQGALPGLSDGKAPVDVNAAVIRYRAERGTSAANV